MSNPWNFLIYLISIYEIVLLPLLILQYVFRKKYVDSFYLKRYNAAINQHPEKKEEIHNSILKLISLFRMMLWLSPFYVIFAPWAIAVYSDLNGIALILPMVLLFAMVFVEYRYEKWLFQYLISLDIA
jgi:hypothetical protein